MKPKIVLAVILLLSLLGIIDSLYLTYEHYRNTIPPCSTGFTLIDCGQVLRSKYSTVFGIPLALYGFLYYSTITMLSIFLFAKKSFDFKLGLLIASSLGFLTSIYLMYLQLVVIGSICLFCTFSAITSILIFILMQIYFPSERIFFISKLTQFKYKFLFKPILFQLDPEYVHNKFVAAGLRLGKSSLGKKIFNYSYNYKSYNLTQIIEGVKFDNPIGLAAGFDYEAKLTQVLPSLGFGFETVGTITNMPYEGNPRPRLGRLPKSKSLMVNKGFKSSGADYVSEMLKGVIFDIPIGVSIGRTNSSKLKTQKQSVADIIEAYKSFEDAKVKNAYYELNISCPNLIHAGKISFYPPKNLEELLTQIDKLKLKRPVFVKMPIEKSNREVLEMLKVIARHTPRGVIFGNLQKDRNHESLDKTEVSKFKIGYFSGKPTFDRSNELISLAYKKYKDRFVIIGCGGVFNANDAWEKIIRGASLIQLITGLIFEGPQLVSQINQGLSKRLEQNGLDNIKQAVGSKYY